MEEKGKARERRLRREFQRSRVEEQLWATAYEEVWPVIRKSIKQSAGPGRLANQASWEAYIARRA
jgi:hypothetical protein